MSTQMHDEGIDGGVMETSNRDVTNVDDGQVNPINVENVEAEQPKSGWTVVQEDELAAETARKQKLQAAKNVQEQSVMNVENIESNGQRNVNMLYRHPHNKAVGGVCGGLADFLGWDPVLVRILWVVATVASGGGGFLAYGALWLLLPVGTSSGGQERPAAIEMNQRNLGMAAVMLISFGILWLLSNLGILGSLWGAAWAVLGIFFWPALLIGAGMLLLNRNGDRDWRSSFNNASNRVRASFANRQPASSNVRSGLQGLRERFPLRRSRRNRMLMGVCGGMGAKLGIDANLVRLIWAAFSIGSLGTGVLLYVASGLFMLDETASPQNYAQDEQDVRVVNNVV
ncbi:MAG: PspC domain-containing protein [Caldilineaceae bacterium]